MDPVTQLILTYRYVILVPLALFEGPVVSFTAGILVATGFLDPLVSFAILLLADLVRDVAYYEIGRSGRHRPWVRRFAGRIGVGDEQFAMVRHLWLAHGAETMLLSKLAYALSPPLLVTAGLVGMPLQRFVGLAMTVTVLQYGLLMALGYYYGNAVGVVTDILQFVGLAIAAAVVVAVISYFVGRYARARLMAVTRPPDDTSN